MNQNNKNPEAKFNLLITSRLQVIFVSGERYL